MKWARAATKLMGTCIHVVLRAQLVWEGNLPYWKATYTGMQISWEMFFTGQKIVGDEGLIHLSDNFTTA